MKSAFFPVVPACLLPWLTIVKSAGPRDDTGATGGKAEKFRRLRIACADGGRETADSMIATGCNLR